jgi:spermidine/putrescine ABC transporter ATP-binding subunit
MPGEPGFLSLRDVSKAYGAAQAVAGVDLDIAAGELLTLLGPSGSGKTTLLMAIAGFVEPDVGDILLQGRSLRGVPPYHRNIGVVFQQYALFPHLTVAQNIAYPLAVRAVSRAERRRAVAEALELVRLFGLADRYPKQLSGGQQQRVALARALVFRPPILLMDEPLGALDRKLRAQMQLEIRGIQQQLGITTVYVTHDQEEALTLSDRIAVMQDGRIAQLGTPLDVYEWPRTPFVAEFLGESNLLRGTVAGSDGGELVVRTEDGLILRTTFREGFRSGDQVLVLLRPEQIQVSPGHEAATGYPGVVESCTYLGAMLRLAVRVGTQELLVTANPRAVPDAVGSGKAVTVRWEPGVPVLLRPESPRH